jgi:hypothetical protein
MSKELADWFTRRRHRDWVNKWSNPWIGSLYRKSVVVFPFAGRFVGATLLSALVSAKVTGHFVCPTFASAKLQTPLSAQHSSLQTLQALFPADIGLCKVAVNVAGATLRGCLRSINQSPTPFGVLVSRSPIVPGSKHGTIVPGVPDGSGFGTVSFGVNPIGTPLVMSTFSGESQ